MMTIALRFIPTLLDETDRIMKAQSARGADFVDRLYHSTSKEYGALIGTIIYQCFQTC